MPELAEKLLVTSNLFLSHLSKFVVGLMLTQTLIATVSVLARVCFKTSLAFTLRLFL